MAFQRLNTSNELCSFFVNTDLSGERIILFNRKLTDCRNDVLPNSVKVESGKLNGERVYRLPRSAKQFSVIHDKHSLVFKAEKIYDALRNAFGKKDDVLLIKVARFERDFNNEYLFYLCASCYSR